jgi:hypothetical protein
MSWRTARAKVPNRGREHQRRVTYIGGSRSSIARVLPRIGARGTDSTTVHDSAEQKWAGRPEKHEAWDLLSDKRCRRWHVGLGVSMLDRPGTFSKAWWYTINQRTMQPRPRLAPVHCLGLSLQAA